LSSSSSIPKKSFSLAPVAKASQIPSAASRAIRSSFFESVLECFLRRPIHHKTVTKIGTIPTSLKFNGWSACGAWSLALLLLSEKKKHGVTKIPEALYSGKTLLEKGEK
jgi:hypothetical protein